MERKTHALRPHPKNKEIYGDRAKEVIADVETHGVMQPLLITKQNVIISGHRRWHSAKHFHLPAVPVVLFESENELDIQEALILNNHSTSSRTNEQIAREMAGLKTIEEARAKERLSLTAAERVNSSPSKKGKSREFVGKHFGLGGQSAERAIYAVSIIDALEKQGDDAAAAAVRAHLNTSIHKGYNSAKRVDPIRHKKVADMKPRYITVDTWRTFTAAEQRSLITDADTRASDGWNWQKNQDIEWAQGSWNPVVGCLHGCQYCYAERIAQDLYPFGFAPQFVPSRLHTPGNITVPQQAETDPSFRNVFVCSMADLFGKWVPKAWIEAVLDSCRRYQQWHYLFLTKFPLRLAEFSFPDNCWVGTTVDCQARVQNAEDAFRNVTAKVKWLSCEPLLEDLTFTSLEMFDWLVIGGSSAQRPTPHSPATPAFFPPYAWVEHLHQQARAANCLIYHKANLFGEGTRIKEFPGSEPTDTTSEILKEFHYPLLKRSR